MFLPVKDDNPTRIVPIVTVAIIGLCVIVYLYQLWLGRYAGERFVLAYGMIPAVLFGEAQLDPRIGGVGPLTSLLTSMFVHGGLMHLLGNMIYLWVFGNNIEDALGHVRFILFYVLCGVAAALTQAFIDPGSKLPMVGASGAISGVLAADLVLHPQARVTVFVWLLIFIRFIQLPAGLVLGIWILFQVFNAATADPQQGGVAWFAHIGGFFAGLLLLPLLRGRDAPYIGSGRSRGPWS
jgi:membrane associated rhomboid family serine protease